MDSLSLDSDRVLHAPVETTRRTVLSALREMGFTVQQSQAGYIQAARGRAWLPGSGPADRPLKAAVAVMGHDGLSRVHVHLADAVRLGSTATISPNVYEPVFRATLEQLDRWFLALDASLETSAPAPVMFHPEAASWVRGQWSGLSRRVSAVRSAAPAQAEPDLWVVTPGAVAVLSANEAHMCLAVASLVTASQGVLPGPLASRLETLTISLRAAIASAALPAGRLDVSVADMQAFDFLYQQGLIRSGLPVREVRRCRDCRLEKVVNPDYRTRARKSQVVRDVVGLTGVVLGPSGAQLFVVAGRLLNMDLLKPAQTPCSRCEGIEWDVSLAVICPQCGGIIRDPVLRRCPSTGCGYDFLSRVAGRTAWRPADAAGVAAQAPAPTPVAAVVGAAQDLPPVPGPSPAQDLPPAQGPPPGWYQDPSARHQHRWFDQEWTEWAADNGVTVLDPLE